MILIEEYILKLKTERQQHLELSSPCLERGGPRTGGLSTYCKGLMAHILDTTIPSGHMIHVCHACNNAKCSNPCHLYWGTAQENKLDQGKCDSIWDRMVKKHGLTDAKQLMRKNSVANASKGGRAGKGKPKSEKHKLKISETTTGKKRGPYKTFQNMPR